MSRPPPYSLFPEADVHPFLQTLPRARRRRLLDDLKRIAAFPGLGSDYSTRDADGGLIDHVLTDDFLVSYHIEHAARRVLILEVVRPT